MREYLKKFLKLINKVEIYLKAIDLL